MTLSKDGLPNKPRGGARVGSGRKMSPLKSAKLAADLLERGKRLMGDENCPTPLELVLANMWNIENDMAVRLDCAKTALPYCSPRLTSVQVSNQDDNRLVIQFVDFTNKSGVIVQRSDPTLDAVIGETIEADDLEQIENKSANTDS